MIIIANIANQFLADAGNNAAASIKEKDVRLALVTNNDQEIATLLFHADTDQVIHVDQLAGTKGTTALPTLLGCFLRAATAHKKRIIHFHDVARPHLDLLTGLGAIPKGMTKETLVAACDNVWKNLNAHSRNDLDKLIRLEEALEKDQIPPLLAWRLITEDEQTGGLGKATRERIALAHATQPNTRIKTVDMTLDLRLKTTKTRLKEFYATANIPQRHGANVHEQAHAQPQPTINALTPPQ